MKKICFIAVLLPMICSTCASIPADGVKDTKGQQEARSEEERPLFTIGVVTDVHHSATKKATAERNYQAAAGRLQEAVDTFNMAKVDMVVSLGDLIDNEIDSYATIAAIFNELEMPVYKILGNHDFLSPYSEEVQNKTLQTMGVDKRYFSMSIEGYRLLFLDGTDIATFSHAKGTEGYLLAEKTLDDLKEEEAANARKYNGMIGTSQKEWLLQELQEASDAGENVICLCHMPFLPLSGKYTLWNNFEMLRIFAKWPCIKTVISGHDHKGGYETRNNVHYLTLCGMVQGDTNSYSIIKVYNDHLEVKGYGREQDATLKHLH